VLLNVIVRDLISPELPVNVNVMLVAEPPLATVELSVPDPVLLQVHVAVCEQVISWTAVDGKSSKTCKDTGVPAEAPPFGVQTGPVGAATWLPSSVMCIPDIRSRQSQCTQSH